MRTLNNRPLTLTLAVTSSCVAGSMAVTSVAMKWAGLDEEMSFALILAALLPALMAPGPTFLLARSATRLRKVQAELVTLANTDTLTGLHNRRSFFQRGTRLLAGLARCGGPCAVMMIDLDRFKWVNDTHGHAVGDEALRAVADAIRGAVPGLGDDCSIIARMGGEEFAVLIAGVEPAAATELADRVCQRIRATSITANDSTLSMTASLGLDVFSVGADIDEVLRAADEACYRAKRLGGDCWVRARREEPLSGSADRRRALPPPHLAPVAA